MPSHACPAGKTDLIPIPRPAGPPDNPLLMGLSIASSFVLAGLLVAVGRALLA
ncbi:MAG TPA: hypothetical protein VKD90_00010 [Gemmataceae bacterium]|nr:hypothetical protein [Gemmataceae bacterium]